MARALVVVLLACVGLGCSVRQRLTDSIIEEAERNYGWGNLPVYPSRHVGARSPQPASRAAERRITPRLAGRIIDRELRDGRSRLWVTFDRRCTERKCALSFAQDGRSEYELEGWPKVKLDVRRSCRLICVQRAPSGCVIHTCTRCADLRRAGSG